jgi:hypothetical protein
MFITKRYFLKLTGTNFDEFVKNVLPREKSKTVNNLVSIFLKNPKAFSKLDRSSYADTEKKSKLEMHGLHLSIESMKKFDKIVGYGFRSKNIDLLIFYFNKNFKSAGGIKLK